MNTFHSVVFELPGILLLSGAMLLFFGQIYVCLLAFRLYYGRKRGALRLAVYVLWAVLGFVLLVIFFEGRHRAWYTDIEREWWPATEYLFELPWAVIALAEAVQAALVVFSIRMILYYSERNITPAVIKEAVDLLPVGICYGDFKRRPVFSNLMINDLCHGLYRESLTDTGRFWKMIREAGQDQEGKFLVEQEDHDYLFGMERTAVKGAEYEQIYVSDVTEVTRITKELKEKNARLLDLQLRMKAFAVESGDFATEQEILNARRAVHDNLGYTLARGAYFMKQDDSSDATGILTLLKSVNDTLLYEAESPEELYQPVEDAIRLSSGIGIRVEVTGELPKSTEGRELLGQAIRECAANTFKHAQGNAIYVKIRELTGTQIEIRNNGQAPKEPIEPAGGLLSLKKSIHQIGGEMRIEWDPEFKLLMDLPYPVRKDGDKQENG